MNSFTIVHRDGVIKVQVDDKGHALVDVQNINDREIVIQAINRAYRAGARTSTLLSGGVVNDQIVRMHTMRAETGTTWLGGKVTRLADAPDGPQFRIDWVTFPQITE